MPTWAKGQETQKGGVREKLVVYCCRGLMPVGGENKSCGLMPNGGEICDLLLSWLDADVVGGGIMMEILTATYI